jgi:hypothetical protein
MEHALQPHQKRLQQSLRCQRQTQPTKNNLRANHGAGGTGELTEDNEEEYYCEVCGRKISKEEYEDYDGMCWECWDDQLTEESETMFGDVL